jgi:DGQHR domain-containing protein
LAFEPGVATFTSYLERLEECFRNHDLENGCDQQIDWGLLQFEFDVQAPEHLRPALIVDGQHRLHGISEFPDEDIPVLVVCMVDASVQEQAFQFIVINNKAVRVPTDNVKAIIAHLDEEQLQSRLLQAGVNYGNMSPVLRDVNDLDTSPFQNLLDWPYNKKGVKLVPISAIEQAIRYMKVLFDFMGDDEDSLLEVFLAVWRAVHANYPDLWGRENPFMTKVNINAVNEFIMDRLKVTWELGIVDIFSTEAIERQVIGILKLIPQIFWETPWSIKIQDNANVRGLIKSDLETLAQNVKLRRNWSEDLKIPLIAD